MPGQMLSLGKSRLLSRALLPPEIQLWSQGHSPRYKRRQGGFFSTPHLCVSPPHFSDSQSFEALSVEKGYFCASPAIPAPPTVLSEHLTLLRSPAASILSS